MRTFVEIAGGFILGVIWQTMCGQRRRRSGTVKVPQYDGSESA